MEQLLLKIALTLLLSVSGRFGLDLTAVRPSIDQIFAESQREGREVAFCVFVTKDPAKDLLIADSLYRPVVYAADAMGVTVEDCHPNSVLGHTHIYGPTYPVSAFNSRTDTTFSCGLSEQDLWTARLKDHMFMIVTSGIGEICWWNAEQMKTGRELRIRYLPAIHGQTTYRMR